MKLSSLGTGRLWYPLKGLNSRADADLLASVMRCLLCAAMLCQTLD
jgi:hypothetical protein